MVSGATNSTAFQRFQSLLKDVKAATDPSSEAGVKIGDSEAGKIVDAFNKLGGDEKTAAATALKGLLQSDVFEVTDGARSAFAKALGVDVNDLKPQAAAGLKRTVLSHAFQMLTGPHKIDKAELDKMRDGLKTLPKELQDFVTVALESANSDGVVKMDGSARKEHVKDYATRNQDGKLDMLADKFGDDFAKRVPAYVLSALSTPPKFEELIFVLMITIVSDTQKEVLEEQKRIADLVSDDQKRSEKKAEQTKAMQTLPNAVKPGTDAPIERPKGDPTARGKHRDEPEKIKRQIEGALSTIHGSIRNDGKIDTSEAAQIVKKFDSFPPGVKKLFAEAVGTAIEHSGAGANPAVKDNIAPIWEWAKKTAGTDTFPAPTPPTEPSKLAGALLASDKLEHRVAGFLVDAFIDKKHVGDIALKKSKSTETVKKFEPLMQEVVKQCGHTDEAHAPASAESKGTEGAVLARFERLVEARAKIDGLVKEGKIPAGKAPTIEADIAKTVDREMADKPVEQRQVMKDALKTAFDALPKDRPATKDDVEAAFKQATGKVTDSVLDEGHPAVDTVVGGAVEKALQRALSKIENITDAGGSAPDPAAKKALLQEALGKAKQDMIQDAALNGGLDDKQLEMLGQVFDRAGEREITKLEKSGTVEPKEPLGRGKDKVDPEQTDDTRSRQIMFENLKFKMNMLSEMMQSMSNILNTMHQNAENTIRAIR